MKQGLLLFFLLLLAATGFYLTADRHSVPVAPPAAMPEAPLAPQASEGVPAAAVPAAAPEPAPHTLRTTLRQKTAEQPAMPAAAEFKLTREKKKEIMPGVTVENKEIRIQLERMDESLHLRRAPNEQMQMVWKQKF
ncbi:MAG: hypothetical protein E6X17_02805 [Sporomusaceae bacterium]|nr:hypothetical protein [Sporomusaceae bacterium]